MERAALNENLQEITKNDLIGPKLEKYIELMKTLTRLHKSAIPAEKRGFVESLFSNRKVVLKNVELEPHFWLLDRKFSDLSPLVTHLDTLIELKSEAANDNLPKDPVTRRYSFEK